MENTASFTDSEDGYATLEPDSQRVTMIATTEPEEYILPSESFGSKLSMDQGI